MDELCYSIVGEVDFGKSTLLGQILMTSGALPDSKISEVKKTCTLKGQDFEPAFLLDAFEIERNQEFTLDYTMALYHWNKDLFRVYDTPGHQQFLHKMLSGSLQAPWFLVLADINQTLTEENLRHCQLLARLGVRHCGVAVNKMDLVQYSNERFHDCRQKISEQLKRLGLEVDFILPISAKYQTGVPELLDAIQIHINQLKPLKQTSLLVVQGVTPSKQVWISGEVIWGPQGKLLASDGKNVQVTLSSVENQMLTVSPSVAQRGDLLVSDTTGIKFEASFEADCFFWREHQGPVCVHFVHAQTDVIQMKMTEKDIYMIQLVKPIWISKFTDQLDVGRFLIHDQKGPCGGGVITRCQ